MTETTLNNQTNNSPIENLANKNISIIAIGGAGCQILKELSKQTLPEKVKLLAIDTDKTSLENLTIPVENRILAGGSWFNGKGCGGNANNGLTALSNSRALIAKSISNSSYLVIIGGLGRGTATGGIQILLSEASKSNIPVMCVLTIPFALEGEGRRRDALNKLTLDLSNTRGAIIALPNDLLFSNLSSRVTLKEAFALADLEVAKCVNALINFIAGNNLIGSNFADFKENLSTTKSYCSLGVGNSEIIDGQVDIDNLLDSLFSSPLLGGPEQLLNADTVIVSLLGGEELTLANAKSIMEPIKKQLRKNCNLIVGINTSKNWQNKVQLTALTVKFDDIGIEIKQNDSRRTGKRKPIKQDSSDDLFEMGGEQLTLFGPDTPQKGIMENTTPVIFEDEDLDIPTFIRKGFTIEKSK